MTDLSEKFHGLLMLLLQEMIDFGTTPFKVVLTEETLLDAYREVAAKSPREAFVLNKSFGLEEPAEFLGDEMIAKRIKLSVDQTKRLRDDGIIRVSEAIMRRWKRVEYEISKRHWEEFIAEQCRRLVPTPIETPSQRPSPQRLRTLLDVLHEHPGSSASDLHRASGSGLDVKTTQRDLRILVAGATARKKGEKRWTRYFPT